MRIYDITIYSSKKEEGIMVNASSCIEFFTEAVVEEEEKPYVLFLGRKK